MTARSKRALAYAALVVFLALAVPPTVRLVWMFWRAFEAYSAFGASVGQPE